MTLCFTELVQRLKDVYRLEHAPSIYYDDANHNVKGFYDPSNGIFLNLAHFINTRESLHFTFISTSIFVRPDYNSCFLYFLV
jgi:hypothetical protein